MAASRDVAKAAVRAEAQRARILDAARRCFADRGFHGATIAAIADTAGMSQGLIYRYFASKAAIIHAITDSQREVRTRTLARIGRCSELVDAVLDRIDCRGDGEGFDAVLFLEITAEASRDPDIAVVVGAQERDLWDDFSTLVQRSAEAAGQPLDPDALRRRTLLFRCLVDGLVLSGTRDPRLDRAAMRAALLEGLADLGL